MKHVFIMNENQKSRDFEPIIHSIMNSYDYQIIYTTSPDEVKDHVSSYQETTRFYAVGGDGTLNSLIQVLVDTIHEVVVIPLGTGNDFCRTLTHEKDPQKILKESLKYEAKKVDVIKVNDQYSMNATCFGVDSVIANHVHDQGQFLKNDHYVLSILRNVFKYDFDEVKIMQGETCLYQGRITLCTFNNAVYYGGGFPIVPHANIHDGYMDLCVVDKVPKFKIPYLITLLLRKKLHHRKEVHYFKLKEAVIYTKQKGNMDGEMISADHYHIMIHPSSLKMVIFDV